MRNWKQLASALGAGIPDAELDRVTGPLDALEAAFRPLATKIPPETEPAYVVFIAREESE
jgi:hypothetical protein